MITAVTLRVHPRPEASRYEGWLVPGFEAGCEALRALERAGAAPDVTRLSDEDETRHTLAFAGASAVARRAVGDRCLMICGWEGAVQDIAPPRGEAARVLRGAGARYATQRPGQLWARARFAGPHLRDHLLDRGVMVETLETATSWSRLGALHAAVRAALPGMHVGCHVSHLYPTGASLYFTVLARRGADPAAQWRAPRPPPRTRSSPPAARSRTTTRSAAITRRGWPPRPASWASACCARSRTGATRPGS